MKHFAAFWLCFFGGAALKGFGIPLEQFVFAMLCFLAGGFLVASSTHPTTPTRGSDE